MPCCENGKGRALMPRIVRFVSETDKNVTIDVREVLLVLFLKIVAPISGDAFSVVTLRVLGATLTPGRLLVIAVVVDGGEDIP